MKQQADSQHSKGLDVFDSLRQGVERGENYFLHGRYAEALNCYIELVDQRLSSIVDTGYQVVDMELINRLVELAALLGQEEAADHLLEGMTGLLQNIGNQEGVAYVTLKRLMLAVESRQFVHAKDLLERIEPFIGPIDDIEFTPEGLSRIEKTSCFAKDNYSDDFHLLLTLFYFAIGKFSAWIGQYCQAEASLQQSQIHARHPGVKLFVDAEVPMQLVRAEVLLEKGEVVASIALLAEIKQQITPLANPAAYLRFWELEAQGQWLLGQFGNSIESWENALSFCRSYNFSKAWVRTSLNLAHIQIVINQVHRAKERIAAVMREPAWVCDPQAVGRSEVLIQLADLRTRSTVDGTNVSPTHWEMHFPKDKRSSYDDSSSELQQEDGVGSESYLGLFENMTLKFQYLLAKRDLLGAKTCLKEIMETVEGTDSYLIKGRLHTLKGLLAYYQGDWTGAEIIFFEMSTYWRKLGLKHELWQVQRFLLWCWTRLDQSEEDRRLLSDSTVKLLQEITTSLSDVDGGIFLLNKWESAEENLAKRIDLLIELKNRVTTKSWWCRWYFQLEMYRQLHELFDEIDFYRHSVVERYMEKKRTCSASRVERVSFNSSLKRLLRYPWKRASIGFLVLPDRLFISTAGWMWMDFQRVPISRIDLREEVRQWHEAMHRLKSINKQPLDDSADKRGGEDLLNDSLSFSIPLHYNETNNYLVRNKADSQEDNAIQLKELASSLAAKLQLPTLLERLPSRTEAITFIPDDCLKGVPFSALVFKSKYLIEHYASSVSFRYYDNIYASNITNIREALVVGVAKEVGDFPKLPGVCEEVYLVHSSWEQHLTSILLENEDASKERIISLLPKLDLWHVACHSDSQANRPDLSGLVLMSADGRKDILSVRDLSRLNLEKIALVFLSSCWSADNYVLPGRWVISLPETLYRVGVRNSVGNLWGVSDIVMINLTMRFYDYLARMPLDEALRQTQLDCLNNRLGIKWDTSSPYLWSGLVCYSNPNKLVFGDQKVI